MLRNAPALNVRNRTSTCAVSSEDGGSDAGDEVSSEDGASDAGDEADVAGELVMQGRVGVRGGVRVREAVGPSHPM